MKGDAAPTFLQRHEYPPETAPGGKHHRPITLRLPLSALMHWLFLLVLLLLTLWLYLPFLRRLLARIGWG
jgi:hypothetical protein